ncbi:MAG: CPBP family intramembrane glutamic endopeptidase [Bacteroidales bacterium]|jgi:membrane protease YdiL (CAAX protease family)
MKKPLISNIPFWGKVGLLVVLLIFFLIIGALLSKLLVMLFYPDQANHIFINPDYQNSTHVGALKLVQATTMFVGMLMPSLIYLWLTKKQFGEYIGINKKSSGTVVVLTIVLFLFSTPISAITYQWNQSMVLPQWLKPVEEILRLMEDNNKVITDAFLSSTTYTSLLVNTLVLALLPAFAEEILFRGIICRGIYGKYKNTHIAVWLSAIIFSAIHFQFYGFLPRMILGAFLGYLFIYSKSLWMPILFHFLNNFSAVVTEFISNKISGTHNIPSGEELMADVDPIVGIACVIIAVLAIIKIKKLEETN